MAIMNCKRGNTEVKIYEDRSSRTPFTVAVRFGEQPWWRPLASYDEFGDAYRYYNDLLA